MSSPAILYESYKRENKENSVICKLCAHYCIIDDGKQGICKVRINEGGKLYSLSWGNVSGIAIDPVEKKPFYHFKPGDQVLSFGTPGCNFRCANCQNSSLSQVHKKFTAANADNMLMYPRQIAELAIKYDVDGIAYTYSEPTIFFEYARDIIRTCRSNDRLSHLYHLFISNGYFSSELIDLIIKEDLLAAINIDLKFIEDKKYFAITGGRLAPVLKNIERIAEHNDKIHLEVINLVIPDENDSIAGFEKISKFIASLSPDIPLHFSRFYPSYRMANKKPTDIESLMLARDIAVNNGLKYVYIGNTNIAGAENTCCPNCGHLLIERNRYDIKHIAFKNKANICPNCKHKINIKL